MGTIICQTYEIAKMFGITRSQVFECIVEGMPRIKRNEFDFLSCLNWYFTDKAIKRIDLTIEERKEKASWDIIENNFSKLTGFECHNKCSVIEDLFTKFINKSEV